MVHSFAQNVGIGTNTPVARLHVLDSAVLFSGPSTVSEPTGYAPPVSGPGVRLFWYPQKAAFRSGGVSGTFWNKDSIGKYSFATGYDTKAKGAYSFSAGISSEATGDYSVALGYANIADGPRSIGLGGTNYLTGIGSVSIGTYNQSLGDNAIGIGYGNKSTGPTSIAIGTSSESNGATSLAFGYNNISSWSGAVTIGSSNESNSSGAVAMGIGTFANTMGMTAVGMFNEKFWVWRPDSWEAMDPIFVVGNGQHNSMRSTAFYINKAGMVGIGTTDPVVSSSTYGLHVMNNGFMQLRVESSSSSAGIEMRAAGGAHSWEMQTSINDEWFMYDRTANQYRLLIKGTGEVGIGTVSPSQKLHVNGPVLATAFNLISDARFKRNIEPMTSALVKLNAIRGVYYEYKNDESISMDLPAGRQTGVIAQEVAKELPEAITTSKEGILSVDYTKLVPLLIESVKELEQKVNAQQQEIERLKQQVKRKRG